MSGRIGKGGSIGSQGSRIGTPGANPAAGTIVPSDIPTPIDAYLDYHGVTPDASLVAADMPDLYQGRLLDVTKLEVGEFEHLTVRAHTTSFPVPVELDGNNIDGGGGQVLEVNGASDTLERLSSNLPRQIRKLSTAGFVTFNATPEATTKNWDVLSGNTDAGFGVMQQTIDTGPTNAVRAHGSLGVGDNIAIASGKRYWFSKLLDAVGGHTYLGLYDPASSFAQVGSTSTLALLGAAIQSEVNSTGYLYAITGNYQLENVIMAYDDNAVFPLGLTNPSAVNIAARDCYSGLAHRWRMNDGIAQGNAAYAFAENDYSASIKLSWIGTPLYVAGRNSGGAASLDGTNFIKGGATTNALTSEDFSFTVWVNASLSATFSIISKTGTTAGYYTVVTSDGSVYFGSKSAGGGTKETGSSVGALTTGYHLVGFTRHGTTVKIYVDGVDVTADPASHENFDADSADFRVGSYNGTLFPLIGEVQDLRLYLKTLSAAEMLRIYANAP